MEALGMILLVIGFIGMFITSIWFLIVAFQESPLWGLGCIFLPFISLIFLVMHWDKAAKPFLASLACILPVVAGMMIGSRFH